MSEPLATYSFLPWLRQGIGNQIAEKDTLGQSAGSANERASLELKLKVEGTPIKEEDPIINTISKTANLIGPGDVTGINRRAVIRTEPKPNVNNFEDNYLPYIEFYEEDFPWRYTPASPDQNNSRRLRPWIVLVVLEENEFNLGQSQDSLPTITVSSEVINTAFPDHRTTWAWAHVQITGALANTPFDLDPQDSDDQTAMETALSDEADNIIKERPNRGISRIICPRKLRKNKNYAAFLIPAFETGRLAGLGEDTSSTKAQQSSWEKSAGSGGNKTFPVYYTWNFRTGSLGDFETLVSVLKPVVTGAESGDLPMDIQNPGYHLKASELNAPDTVNFEVALKPPGFEPEEWGLSTEFAEKLREILNLVVDITDEPGDRPEDSLENNPFYTAKVTDDPVITPPIYGYWHSLIRRLGQNNPQWIRMLNLDPRYRAAAGLGTKVIQRHQDKLMDEAWNQIEDVNAANRKILQAELAKKVANAIYNKHLQVADMDRFLALTSDLHRLVLNQGATERQTILQQFRESRVPLAAQAAAFRRISRPGNKIVRGIQQMALEMGIPQNLHNNMIANFNATAESSQYLSAAGLKTSPINTLDLGQVNNEIQIAIDNYQASPDLMVRDVFYEVLKQGSGLTGSIGEIQGGLIQYLESMTNIDDNLRILTMGLIENIEDFNYSPDNQSLRVTLNDAAYETTFGFGANRKTFNHILVDRTTWVPEFKEVASGTLAVELQEFRSDFELFQNKVMSLSSSPQLPPSIGNLSLVHETLLNQLSPNYTIKRRLGYLLRTPDPKPIMAHPEFKKPAYEYLKEISQSLILPNVSDLEENSITLLENNQRFIESFLAGLNHEMARELLWREYPTDQRGSYFRQFWDASDNLEAEEEDLKKDICPMHRWTYRLGDHRPHPQYGCPDSGVLPTGDDDGLLVLVVRGELLRKFPNTMIYAQKAKYNTEDKRIRELPKDEMGNVMLDQDILHPVFSAELEPDIFLFGFNLEEDVAKGERAPDFNTDTSGMNAGYFFVFRERPGQTRFGLDIFTDDQGNQVDPPITASLEEWNDLSWQHLVSDADDLDQFLLLDYNPNSPPPEANISLSSTPTDEPNPTWGDNAADMAFILYQVPVIFARHAAEMLP